MNENIIDAVRAAVRGIYTAEAGAELLIRSHRIHVGAPWIKQDGERASIDIDKLLDEAGAWSGGEQRLVRIAASLLGGHASDLSEDIPGLDRTYTRLVLAAIAHANGSHEHSGLDFDDNGEPTGFSARPPLYAWPEN